MCKVERESTEESEDCADGFQDFAHHRSMAYVTASKMGNPKCRYQCEGTRMCCVGAWLRWRLVAPQMRSKA